MCVEGFGRELARLGLRTLTPPPASPLVPTLPPSAQFENWRPVFSGQWNDECTHNLSIAKVVQEHPDWTNSTQVYEQAALEFETAAMDIFVGMINIGKSIAPRAKWGFYGYPANLIYGCNNQGDDPQCGYHNDQFGTAVAQRWYNENKYQRVRWRFVGARVSLRCGGLC